MDLSSRQDLDLSPETRKAVRYFERNPAVRSPEWLVGTPWPEVDEMAAEHQRLLAAMHTAAGEINALTNAHIDEDRERWSLELKAARGEDVEVPPEPDAVARVAALRALRLKLDAAVIVVAEYAAEVMQRMDLEYTDFKNSLNERNREALDAIEEARRVMAEAQDRVADVRRAEHWLARQAQRGTVGAMGPMPYLNLPVQAPKETTSADLAAQLRGYSSAAEYDAAQDGVVASSYDEGAVAPDPQLAGDWPDAEGQLLDAEPDHTVHSELPL